MDFKKRFKGRSFGDDSKVGTKPPKSQAQAKARAERPFKKNKLTGVKGALARRARRGY